MSKIIFSGGPRKSPKVWRKRRPRIPRTEEEKEMLRKRHGTWNPFRYLDYYLPPK